MDLKKLLNKMHVKYYLSDSIKVPFENSAFGPGMFGPALVLKA